jgi:Alpha/beta hydrolase family
MGERIVPCGAMRPALTGLGNEHAIVFIHGLGGSPLSTWESMLALIGGDAAFDRATLDCYSYPTKLLTFPIPWVASPPGMKEIVEGLQTFLHDRFNGFKRIDLVAHSLGGVVARALIVEEMRAKSTLPIKKVALISVPNSGASLANVGSQISFRHRQLKALCKNSSIVQNIEKLWKDYEVDQKIDIQYILGGQDRCVPRDSACNDPETRPSMLINADHRNIVSPKDRQDGRYTILTKFLISGSTKGSAPIRPADPLFEQYKPEHEQYYIQRNFDDGLAKAISAGHIWVCGKSGVGKSAALRRAVHRNQWIVSSIGLSAYEDTSPLGMIRALADELSILATNNPASLPDRSFEAAFQSIRVSLIVLCRDEARAVIVEEIPLGENALPEFLDYLSKIVNTLNGEECIASRLVFAFSSIIDLANVGSIIPDKTRECFQILPDPEWSLHDIRVLVQKLAEWLKMPMSTIKIEQICAAADGRPRFVKQLFRHYRNGSDQGEPLSTLIERVRSEKL